MGTYHSAVMDEAELVETAQHFARLVSVPSLLCLEGDLGAGKTTFARAWIRTITGEFDVPSPTFSLVQEYMLPDQGQMLYHADLFRVSDRAELEEVGFFEMLHQGVSLVEWASRIPDLAVGLPIPSARLSITSIEQDFRRLSLVTEATFWGNIAEELLWKHKYD